MLGYLGVSKLLFLEGKDVSTEIRVFLDIGTSPLLVVPEEVR